MTSDDRKQNPSHPLTSGAGTTPQEQPGADVGGIGRTADSAIRESKQAPDRAPGIEPARQSAGAPGGRSGDSSEPLAGTQGGPTAVPDALGPDASDDPPGHEDESAAESLGRAIGAPLSGEAAKREPRR